MDEITKQLKDFYTKSFDEHGANAKGVNWGEGEKANMRYEAMLNVMQGKDQGSILDVGCGYGGLYLYAKEQGMNLKYHGIDVAENMIVHANMNAEEATFECRDIFDISPEKKFDYVVCNGILTQKLKASDGEMDAYLNNLVQKMFSLAHIGIAFNVMTKKVDFEADNLYYRDPAEVLNFGLSLSCSVKVNHAYPLYEFTTYIYKDQS